MTTTVASDAACRKRNGGDLRVAIQLAGALAEAPKDRSADYLCGAKDHPALTDFAQTMAKTTLNCKLLQVRNEALDLPHRALAALSALSIGPRGEISRGTSGLDALLTAFRELGVPEELVAATGIAAARSREPITVMVPLIWLAARDSKKQVHNCPISPLVEVGGVPVYALDMHTRLGREAIWRFVCENAAVRACLARYVPKSRWRSATYVGTFYIDAAPIARRLIWDQSEAVEAFGVERDLLHAGVLAEGIRPLLETMRANLEHLNALRARILAGSQLASSGRARAR